MKESTPQFNNEGREIPKEHNQEKQHKRWAHEVADKYEIGLDEGEQHFVIPIYDENKKEIRKEFILTREQIPLVPKGGGRKSMVPIETVIEAVKKYPDRLLSEAIEKLKSDKKDGA